VTSERDRKLIQNKKTSFRLFGKQVYDADRRPKNRLELFRLALRERLVNLPLLNACYLLFWIPTIFVVVWYLGALMQFGDTLDVSAARPMTMLALLGLVPCIALTGPAHAGIAYVARDMARDRYLTGAIQTFWKQSKANWKQGLIISTVSGLLPVSLYLAWTYYMPLVLQGTYGYSIPLVLLTSFAISWALIQPCLFVMLVTYRLPLRHQILNAVLLTLRRPLSTVGIRLLPLSSLAVTLPILYYYDAMSLPGSIVSVLSIAYYLSIGLALEQLIHASFANMVCEAYLNPQIDGAYVNIGLNTERQVKGEE